MRPLLTIALLVLLVATLVSSAEASREVVIQPLDNSNVQRIEPGDLPAIVPSGCTVGNLNPPYYAISDWALPPEEYKYVFNPMPNCGVCPVGYQVTQVHILLQTAAANTLVMGVDLEDAVFPEGPDCPYPGPEDCFGGLYQVNLPGAGLYDVALPIECGCAFLNYTYLLSVHFQSATAAVDLVTDNRPGSCTSWNDWGQGWQDLFTYGFPGNLLIWADAVCCEPPISTDTETWSTLKGMFRN
jgi:hypothetical protein